MAQDESKRFLRLIAASRVVKEQAVIWLAALLGVTFSVSAFLVIDEQFSHQRSTEFTWVSHNRSSLLKQGLESALEQVRLTRDHIQASGVITQAQFHIAANPLLSRNPGLEMIGLILYNKNLEQHAQLSNQRPESEADIEGAKFTLSYVEACDNSRFDTGFSFASQPVLYEAIQRAEASGAMAVSGRIDLQQRGKNDYGVLVALPLNNSADSLPAQARPPLTGFVVAVLRLDELVHVAISYLEPRGVDLLILDESASGDKHFLEFYASRLGAVAEFREQEVEALFNRAHNRVTKVVQMADRKWSISAMPNARFMSAEAFSSGAWVVLVGGTLLTLLITIYLLRMKISVQERLRMSQQLKDREELFWQMTETVDDIYWAITPDFSHFLYISPAFEAICGITCESVYQDIELYRAKIHPEDRHLWADALILASDNSSPQEVFYRISRSDGTERWIRDNIFPVRDDSGAIYRLVGVAEDISEKKWAEDALRESENKLKTLFNQSPDTIMTVGRSGNIHLMNRGVTLEPGGSRRVASDSAELLPETCRENYRQLLTRAFDKGEVSYLPYQNNDASWCEIRIVPIMENEKVATIMVISTDITEKRNLQALTIHNARLASIGEMATGVAHDINNPNNAIKTAATLFGHVWNDALPLFREYYHEQGDFSLGGLSFAAEGEALGELITDIQDNSRRIEIIVGNLKQLGKGDHGSLSEVVDINSVLHDVVGVLGSSISSFTDHWRMNLAETLPGVKGNVSQLEQVFINIILNALQALPDKEHGVLVESFADNEKMRVVIRVTDQGTGIAIDNIPMVTEPFFTTKLESGGTGLGLSISHTIVKNHQGVIHIESSVGQGTVVTVGLPQKQ